MGHSQAPQIPTPAHQAQLEEEVPSWEIEDLNHTPVEAVALNPHPGQASEQAEVQEHGACLTSHFIFSSRQGHSNKEADVEEEDGPEEIHVDMDNIVSLFFPVEDKI